MVPALPVPRRGVRRDEQTLYAALSAEIQALGLLRRRHGYYAARIAGAVALVAGALTAHVLLGDTWWQLLVAALLGISLTQAAFLGHDAGHRQIFASARWNEWTARLVAGVLVGMSYGWWNSKHSRHHSAPNQVAKDPDIAPGPLVWTPEIARERRGAARWLAARQGWLFFPLLLLAGLSLHVSSFRAILGGAPMKRRRLELALVVARLGGYVALVFVLLPPGMAAAFIGVHLAVFGVYMGMSFAPNHKGMPLVPRGATVDFLRRQVLMSRNVRGGRVLDVVMGGLNLQIEHHLFPSMPTPNLRRAAPVVKAFCERHGVAYTQAGVLQSYAIVVRYLNQVGLGARDPFQCPLVQVYRPV
ncbi:MAG: fatty acid desaturase family protein [Kineosporiaceae bacterium]